MRGLGSTLLYAGREYISVTMFKGFVNQLFFSRTGTSGMSSSAGSSASQAQPLASRRAWTSARFSAGAQPSKKTMVPSVRRRSVFKSSAASALSRSA